MWMFDFIVFATVKRPNRGAVVKLCIKKWVFFLVSFRQVSVLMPLFLTTTPTLSRRTSVVTLSTSHTPHMILIIRRSTPRNFASSATVSFHVSQQCNKTGLTQHWWIFPRCFKDKPCFPTNTPLNSQNYQFLHSLPRCPTIATNHITQITKLLHFP